MDREQGRLFLEYIKTVNNYQTFTKFPSLVFSLSGKYKIDKLLMCIGTYYLYKKSKYYISNISIYNILKRIPYINGYLNKRINNAIEDIKEEFKTEITDINKNIPENGLSITDIQNIQSNYKNLRKFKYENGYVSGTVYTAHTPEYINLMIDTTREFLYTNPLHPDVFPDIKLMEAEVINIVKRLFNGGDNCCGNMTSGGTESILLACKTYRDWARDKKGITEPEIIVGESVHASFDKAGHYFNIKIVKVPIDINTGKVNIKAMKKKINRNTICIVGSAPSFAHGVIDDIEIMSDIADRNNIGLHVDCCLGGFILPFMKKIGLLNYEYDFNLRGVTSISLDPHKYGYSMKGSSIILYNSKLLRKYQYYINSGWNGGIYATPTISGSRSGVSVATTWSALMYHGLSGYTESALNIVKLKNSILHQVMKIDDLIVIGTPISSVIAFRSEKFDIYVVGTEMTKKGWNLNILQNPASFHLCITLVHVKNNIKKRFVSDLIESVDYAKQNSNNKLEGTCAIYGMTKSVGNKDIIDEVAVGYLDALTEI